MIRFGLCCLFHDEPIKFRRTTATALSRQSPEARLEKVSELCLSNASSLLEATRTVKRLGIGAFRVMSPLFPLYTHPRVGYRLDDLLTRSKIEALFEQVNAYCRREDIRLSFHPDQFVILSSPRPNVVESSIGELAYQATLAEMIGAEELNIHLGGVYDSKETAKARFIENFQRLPENARRRLTLENDDKSYHVEDLIPVCEKLGIPLVYDVHHHRCNPDSLTVERATDAAVAIWRNLGKEPHFHVSSPRDGWNSARPQPHADMINPEDFPEYWKRLPCPITVDVEAKAKELAVIHLMNALR